MDYVTLNQVHVMTSKSPKKVFLNNCLAQVVRFNLCNFPHTDS